MSVKTSKGRLKDRLKTYVEQMNFLRTVPLRPNYLLENHNLKGLLSLNHLHVDTSFYQSLGIDRISTTISLANKKTLYSLPRVELLSSDLGPLSFYEDNSRFYHLNLIDAFCLINAADLKDITIACPTTRVGCHVPTIYIEKGDIKVSLSTDPNYKRPGVQYALTY